MRSASTAIRQTAVVALVALIVVSTTPKPANAEPITITTAATLQAISIGLQLLDSVLSFLQSDADPTSEIIVGNKQRLNQLHDRLDNYDKAITGLHNKLDQLPDIIRVDMIRLFDRESRTKVRAAALLIETDFEIFEEEGRTSQQVVPIKNRIADLQTARSTLIVKMSYDDSLTIENINALILSAIYELSALRRLGFDQNSIQKYAKHYLDAMRNLLPRVADISAARKLYLESRLISLRQLYEVAMSLKLKITSSYENHHKTGTVLETFGRCGMSYTEYAWEEDLEAKRIRAQAASLLVSSLSPYESYLAAYLISSDWQRAGYQLKAYFDAFSEMAGEPEGIHAPIDGIHFSRLNEKQYADALEEPKKLAARLYEELYPTVLQWETRTPKHLQYVSTFEWKHSICP